MSLPGAERNISSRFWAVMKYAKPYKAAFVLSVLLLAADIVYDVGYAWYSNGLSMPRGCGIRTGCSC